MRKLNWRTVLMGLITLALSASLLFQMFYVLPTIRNQQMEMVQSHQEEIAHNIAWELDSDLIEMENTLIEIADRAEFRNMDIANQQQTVTRFAELSPGISSLYVMDADGWFVAGTAEDLSVYQKKSYTDKPYYLAAVGQGHVYFSAPRSYSENTIVSTSISVPIESDEGERVGLLLGTIWLTPLIEKLKNYPLDEETAVFLVDNEGTVVAHSGIDLFALEEGPLSLDYSDHSLVQSIMAGEVDEAGQHDHEGTPHLGHYVILEANSWGVVVETPTSVILAESNLLTQQLLLVNVVLFTIVLAVSLFFTQRITTERKRVEDLLQKSEEWLSTTLRSIGDAVIATDAQGLVTLMNPIAEDLTGWDEAEAVDKPLEDVFNIINEQTGERAENPVAKILQEGVVVGLANHTVLIAKDGTKRPIADSGAPMRDEEGNLIGTVMVFRDITELKEMQERLVRNEKLVVLGQLSGGVGHELRNPLGVISNAIYFLKTTIPDENETVNEYLEIISSEVYVAEKIISDLLDFSRTKPLETERTDVSELVAQVLKKHPAPENIKVTQKLAPDLHPLYVDPQQIHQVLVNLVVNAYDAMPEGGELTINAQAKKSQMYLAIADTGCGISKKNMDNLFEPLFTTKARGIGLGLAVSKNLVEANGGSIKVKSKEGQGSTFTVILPTEEVVS